MIRGDLLLFCHPQFGNSALPERASSIVGYACVLACMNAGHKRLKVNRQTQGPPDHIPVLLRSALHCFDPALPPPPPHGPTPRLVPTMLSRKSEKGASLTGPNRR